jgi:hypothetical protein
MKWLGVVVVGVCAACEISIDDPLPHFGAPCRVDEGLCGVEYVCQPETPGGVDGACVPVSSYGACDDIDGAPRHPPGRLGEVKTASVIEITSAAQMDLIANVRKADGLVKVFEDGPGDADVGNLCKMRTLQRVGDGLGIGDSDITTLDGLQSLTSVDSGIAIFNNRQLTSVDALENVVQLGARQVSQFRRFQLVIANNPRLPQFDVDAVIARLEAQTGGSLDVVACSNQGGPACAGDDQALALFLTQNGLR